MAISKHKTLLAILDAVIVVAGFNIGFWYVFGSGFYHAAGAYPKYYVPSIILAVIIFLTVFQLAGLYKYQAVTNPMHQIQTLLKCYTEVLGAFIVIIFFSKTSIFADSRLTIGLSFLASFLIMLGFRTVLVPRIYFYMVARGKLKKRTLIVGAGSNAMMVCKYFSLNPRSYFDIVGFCDDDATKREKTICHVPIVGTSYELENFVQKLGIREIIIAINNISKSAMLDLIDRCKKAGVAIHVISEIYETVNDKMEAEEYGGLQTYRIVTRQNGIVRRFIKRAVDLVGSGILLLLISPLFALIAVVIKHESKGPVFYRNHVIGKGGRPFRAYKFRSMYDVSDNATDDWDTTIAKRMEEGKKRHVAFMKDFIQGRKVKRFYVEMENRITKVGRFLRKYSLDELPQLINVFRGEMSLAGPRFCTVTEYGFYKTWHRRRFEVRPGITGLWQVSGRSAVSYDDMVLLDIYYIENMAFFFDLEILLRTFSVVLTGKGSRIEAPLKKTLSEKLSEMEVAVGHR